MGIDVLAVRVDQLERRTSDIERDLDNHDPKVHTEQIGALREAITGLRDDFRDLRRALIVASIGICSSCLILAATVYFTRG